MFFRTKILAALAVGVVAGLFVLLISWGNLAAAVAAAGFCGVGMFLVLCGGGVAAPSTDEERLQDDAAQMADVRRKSP